MHVWLLYSRQKSARVINYEEFQKALEELSSKKFKGKSKEEAYESICKLVAGKEPASMGVTVLRYIIHIIITVKLIICILCIPTVYHRQLRSQ